MDELEYLSDDHSLLSSQVIHVVALVRAVATGRFELAQLHSETIRQAELLQRQLAEHFEFEEMTAFPKLAAAHPSFAARLQQCAGQHAGILRAFDDLQLELATDPTLTNGPNLVFKISTFEKEFERHASLETRLLEEMAASVRGRSKQM